ncbi:MAG: TIGR03936 family radical SAM-associated protein [Ruminococcus flavefaciens]|nr:TIGR03936 family radical SAM-associated protein [Ruminococcus flavefaciens]
MIKLRAVFEKKDRAKYISHLDLNRCMLRTFRRSGLPIWYTEGFHSHPYFSFALALSLGYESSCEILDFNLNEDIPFDEIRNRLNAVMPYGMKIISVAEPKLKITAIAKAEYSFSLKSDDIAGLVADIEKLLQGENIFVEKKTKKGIQQVDIKPFIEVISADVADGSYNMVMRLPAGTQTNYNPALFFTALKNVTEIPFETAEIRRTAILCEDGKVFE